MGNNPQKATGKSDNRRQVHNYSKRDLEIIQQKLRSKNSPSKRNKQSNSQNMDQSYSSPQSRVEDDKELRQQISKY